MRYMASVLTALLLSLGSVTTGYTNPVPLPSIVISEFSTDEDWIEVYGETWLLKYFGIYINGIHIEINTSMPDSLNNNIPRYLLLNQTNTAGFDLQDDFGSIYIPNTDMEELRYGLWGPVPSPPPGESIELYSPEQNYHSVSPELYGIQEYPSPNLSGSMLAPRHGDSDVVINEIFISDQPDGSSFIELYNRGDSPCDISYWCLVARKRYRIPLHTILDPGEFWVLHESQFPDEFLLSPSEGSICFQHYVGYLYERVGWSERENPDYSLCRYPDGGALIYNSYDTETAIDFRETIPTPGTLNQELYPVVAIKVNVDTLVVFPGRQQEYICTGTDSHGNQFQVKPNWSFEGDCGSIDDYGVLTITSDGIGRVTALWGNLTEYSYVFSMSSKTLDSDTVITEDTYIYRLIVPEDITLRIMPGVNVFFISNNISSARLEIHGTIDARGEQNNPIIFKNIGNSESIALYGTNNVFRYCRFENISTGVAAVYTDDAPRSHDYSRERITTIEHCIFINNISNIHSRGGVVNISNCIFKNGQYALSLNGVHNNSKICHNTLISMATAFQCISTSAEIVNNCVYNCVKGFDIHNVDPYIHHNDIWQTEDPFYYGGPEDLGEITTTNANGTPCDQYFNIFADPMFANPEAGDFRLLSGSPCIDAGDPTILDGDGTISDIGCWSGIPPVGIALTDDDRPDVLTLYPNVPNPFNPSTTIPFALPESCRVRLEVYSITGQKVATLVDGHLPAGSHHAVFDGNRLPSGMYITRLIAGGTKETGKMLLVK